jgi:DNA-binding PadR family transcriptional regulator
MAARKPKTEVTQLGKWVMYWRTGHTITSVAKEANVSQGIMSDRLHEAMEDMGRRRILLLLSEAEDEMDVQQIKQAVGEKQLDELVVLNRLSLHGLISGRHVGNPPPPYLGRAVYRLTSAGWDEVGVLRAQQVAAYGDAGDVVICRGAVSGDPVADSMTVFWSPERQEAARRAVHATRNDWCTSSMDEWTFRHFRCPQDKQPGMAGLCSEHAAQFNIECSLDLPPLGSRPPELPGKGHLRLVPEDEDRA